ncbi:MAG: Fic family protein [Microscillaceae bacterium]|jgi:Fic family protein|nr:Fic family protein [Microscillaceae bacterium]
MNIELNSLIDKINTLKKEIDLLRPISPELEQRIMQKFRLDWNYHSNAIEGNTLTYGETKTFILYGLTAKGKPFKDHLDIKGHNEAILWLDDIIKKNRPITETFIRELNKLLLGEPEYKSAKTPEGQPTQRLITPGQYKTTPNHVLTATGEMFYFATPEETPAKMNDLVDWLRLMNDDKDIPSVVTAALLHYKFIRIHPFDDGNGRTARILMNLILMSKGYLPVIIKSQPKEKKDEYYTALRIADGGDENTFVSFIAQQLVYSMELFIKGAKGESIEEPDDVDKEIQLLKVSLQSAQEKTVLNEKTQSQIEERFIKPFFEKLNQKLSQFDEFFIFSNISYVTGFSAFIDLSDDDSWKITSQAKFQSIFSNINDERIIGMYYQWKDFKKTNTIVFNYSIHLIFEFDKFDFTISVHPSSFEKIKINYNQLTPEDLYLDLINKIVKDFIVFIKGQINGEGFNL